MRAFIAILCALIVLFGAAGAHADERRYAALGSKIPPPIGWTQFCRDYPADCTGGPTEARDVVLARRAWDDLNKVNRWVNERISPLSDLDHWGVVEKWSYPDDGYGDCEDYVLLKRRLLIQAGWPRSALLITVVRDKKYEGHAVLTVKTDRGEFILDNQVQEVLPWYKTDYHFVKRQSQTDQNIWVAILPEATASVK